MGGKDFYSNELYRIKQSTITKLNWQKGVHDLQKKRIERNCKRKECGNKFTTIPSDVKVYCSQRCSTMVNNSLRILSAKTRYKISQALIGRKYPNRPKKSPEYKLCLNPNCGKRFMIKYWRPAHNPQRFCSVKCAVHVTGSQPTSPRAARAKAGIRQDINSKIYFYSRWEANYARILNFLGNKWIHQPKRFKLKSQYYTPDFYLPEKNTYVEIKNFLSDYSKKRDDEFRELYPKEKLILILKNEYQKLENKYAPSIKEWEFSR